MSPETPNLSPEQENTADQTQTDVDSILKDAVDPRDLVMKPGDIGDPKELLSNPAMTPQTLDERRDLRDDLRRD
jgi:hypothetical protein